jgi:hypothetical protein
MIARAAYLTPMLHVADVRPSITFYRLLGLELMDYEGDPTCPRSGDLSIDLSKNTLFHFVPLFVVRIARNVSLYFSVCS